MTKKKSKGSETSIVRVGRSPKFEKMRERLFGRRRAEGDDRGHRDIGPVPGCDCADCVALTSGPLGLLGAIRSLGARMVVGRQTDDIVTEAVKEAYAAGVTAALEEARNALRSSVVGKTDDRVILDDAKLDAAFAEIPKRLAAWKVVPT